MKLRYTTVASFGLIALLCTAAALASAPQTEAAPATIPFTLTHGNIVLNVELTPGHSLPLVFDSGLSRGNIIGAETAQTLGLKSTGNASYTDSGGNNGVTGVTHLKRIKAGPVVLRDQRFAITPLPKQMSARPGKSPIAGFLGAPFMKDAVVCIDYSHNTLTHWQRSNFNDAKFANAAMPLNHALPTITVTVDGEPATLVVDSGNNGGVELFTAFVRAHNLIEKYPNLKPRKARAGSGKIFHTLSGVAGKVEVGPDTLKQVPLLFVAQAFNPAWGIDGFVGYKFLKRLNPCLDRDGQRLLWTAVNQNTP